MLRLIITVVIGLSFSLLSACSILSPVATPQMITYRLQAVNQQHAGRAPSRLTLLVLRPTASPGYHTNAMIYSTDHYLSETFAKNQWVAPPAQMLLPLIVTSLQNTHYFHAVVAPPFPGLADLDLNIQLLQFQQEFIEGESQFRMVLRAELINNNNNRVIVEQQFAALIPAPENNPHGGVIAANQATTIILQQLAKWCVQNANMSRLPVPEFYPHHLKRHRIL